MLGIPTLLRMASAVIALCFACGVAAAAQDGPSVPVPAASVNPTTSSPLRLIGRVHAKTAFCRQVLDSGGLATAAALEGDGDIVDDVRYLSKTDLDSSELARDHAVAELAQRFTTLHTRALAAVKQAKALRDASGSAPTSEQKSALVAYADALSTALHRQLELANALAGFTVVGEAHQTVTEQEHDLDYSRTIYTRLGPWEHSADPRDRNPGTFTQMARNAASALDKQRVQEREDEARAAEWADAGFSPCLK